MILLEAKGLCRTYPAPGGRVLRAVDDVSLQVTRGETLGLVGESGCGKSTLGRCLLRLQTPDRGTIGFDGVDITALSQRSLRKLRPRMQMVFQDPAGSLNPRRRAGELIAEPLRIHRLPDGTRRSSTAVAARVAELVDLVGLRAEHLDRYAHEFSGGQRQRIGIARALALAPDLLVADEPVSALDVSVQAQVVNLLMDLQESLALTMIFIAHDLAVIRQVATRVAVMYLGAIVELAPTDTLFAQPAHPYTAALLEAVPRIGAVARPPTPTATATLLRGEMPSPIDPPPGCAFHTRCPRAEPLCRTQRPILRESGLQAAIACHFPLVEPETPLATR